MSQTGHDPLGLQSGELAMPLPLGVISFGMSTGQ